MEETRIDLLESRFDELAAEMRSGFRDVDARLCRIESRLEPTASKVGDIELLLGRIEVLFDSTATKSDLNNLRIDLYKHTAEMKTLLLATTITIIALFLFDLFALHHWNG